MNSKKPKGRVPSLIGGSNGRPRRTEVKKKSHCFRCDTEIPSGKTCIEIPKIGGGYTNYRRVCDDCYRAILKKTSEDMEEIAKL